LRQHHLRFIVRSRGKREREDPQLTRRGVERCRPKRVRPRSVPWRGTGRGVQRFLLSGEASAIPKTRDGIVE